MGENTKIEWADHTFNAVVGCQKVSAACDHCYAESWAKRTGQSHLWNGERRRTGKSTWDAVRHWNKRAGERGVRERVFGPSLADPFDNQWEPEWRADYFRLIAECPNLDFLLLTKRPQNINRMLPRDWGSGYPNVWLGTTTEDQTEADRRIPHLLSVPARVRFLSCEPLLGAIDLGFNEPCDHVRRSHEEIGCWRALNWVIAGGESGPHARPMNPNWARSLRDQCAAVGVAFHFKQWGEFCPAEVPAEYAAMVDRGEYDKIARYKRAFTRFGPVIVERVGKKAAGRLLDGVEHNGFPPYTEHKGEP